MFEIDKYLDSLPDNVDVINVSYKDLDYLPNLSRFKKLKCLYCDHNKLTSLPVLPENLKMLKCSDNKLTSLLPILPENLKFLYCYNNNLTSLPVLPKNLKELCCFYNKLTSLPVLSENLEKLDCSNNKLTSFSVLPQKLKALYCYGNPIDKLIYNNNPSMLNKNIIILNNFRHLFYCLKYRKIFLKMMEPIIKKRYHPSYLYDLKEDDDLDKKLDGW